MSPQLHLPFSFNLSTIPIVFFLSTLLLVPSSLSQINVGNIGQIAAGIGNVAQLAGSIGSAVQGINNVRGSRDQNRYEPFQIGGGGGVDSSRRIGGNLLEVAQGIANCDPNIQGLCCLMPNHCVPVARCSSTIPQNMLGIVSAIPICTCPPGYMGDGRTRGTGCQNIDECKTGEAKCDQICQDLSPGYACGCRDGYLLLPDHYSCKDLDECSLPTSHASRHRCSHTCNNTLGGYTCGCPRGFELMEDGRTCVDIDECTMMIATEGGKRGDVTSVDGLIECMYPELCINLQGGYACGCPLGYSVDPTDLSRCVDLDECSGGLPPTLKVPYPLCLPNREGGEDEEQTLWMGGVKGEGRQYDGSDPSQSCVNSLGAFECRCSEGYEVAVADKGEEIGLLIGRRVGGEEGTLSRADIMKQQYTTLVNNMSSLKCKDINECINPASNPCIPILPTTPSDPNLLPQCVNSPGSFRCVCPSGYEYVPESATCVDIDECLKASKGGEEVCEKESGEVCTNTPGSYTCSCGPGFISSPLGCEDKNECLSSSHNCSHSCRNTFGGFNCSCPPGFRLGSDGRSCEDVDECSFDVCPPQTGCLNLPGSYICGCPRGFSSRGVAVAIGSDEELLRRLPRDLRTVIAGLRNYNPGDLNSSYIIAEEEGIREGVIKELEKGLGFIYNCEDIDECSSFAPQMKAICPSQGRCINTVGGFHCECREGFRMEEGKEQDMYTQDVATRGDDPEGALRDGSSANSVDGGGLLGSFTSGLFSSLRLGRKLTTAEDTGSVEGSRDDGGVRNDLHDYYDYYYYRDGSMNISSVSSGRIESNRNGGDSYVDKLLMTDLPQIEEVDDDLVYKYISSKKRELGVEGVGDILTEEDRMVMERWGLNREDNMALWKVKHINWDSNKMLTKQNGVKNGRHSSMDQNSRVVYRCRDINECLEKSIAIDGRPSPVCRTQDAPCCSNTAGGYECYKKKGSGKRRVCPTVRGELTIDMSA